MNYFRLSYEYNTQFLNLERIHHGVSAWLQRYFCWFRFVATMSIQTKIKGATCWTTPRSLGVGAARWVFWASSGSEIKQEKCRTKSGLYTYDYILYTCTYACMYLKHILCLKDSIKRQYVMHIVVPAMLAFCAVEAAVIPLDVLFRIVLPLQN